MHPNLTIFYADDDAEDLYFFSEVVNTMNGVSLHTVDHGNALIEALHNPPPTPNIIFLDLNMPGKNGFEVLRELRDSQDFRDIPVVIFSTSSDEKTIFKTHELGATFYLPKQENYESFKKSIQYTLSIDWKSFQPTRENFLYSAA